MSFNVLWTDALLYLLLVSGIVFLFWARKQAHLRIAWQDVTQNRLAMMAAVIFAVYLIIALLDSVHFQYVDAKQQNYVSESLLDYLVSPLGQQDEKTYSAPFATHLFTKDFVKLPDGTTVQDYPRLEFGGRYLINSNTSKAVDILQRIAIANYRR